MLFPEISLLRHDKMIEESLNEKEECNLKVEKNNMFMFDKSNFIIPVVITLQSILCLKKGILILDLIKKLEAI